MTAYRHWIVPIRIVWSVALVAALYLFVTALARLPEPGTAVLELTLASGKDGGIRISPERGGRVTQAGIYEGDVLVAVNDVPVTSIEQAQGLIHRTVGGAVPLTVRTGDFPERRVSVLPRTDSRRVLGSMGFSGELLSALDLGGNVLLAVVSLAAALVIALKKWDDGFALLVSLTLIVVLVGTAFPVLNPPSADLEFEAFLGVWLMLALGLLLAFFYLFPSGRFTPPQTRWLLLAFIVWVAVGLLAPSVYPWEWNPLVYTPVLLGVIGTGVFAQARRFRASANAEEKQQIRWVLFGAVAAVSGVLLQTVPYALELDDDGSFDLLYGLVLFPLGLALRLALPLSIGIAILRYRLWDIDLVINRTLVYGSLTVSIVAIYILGVSVLAALFHTTNNLVVSLVITGMVAVLFQPLRERLQRGVNHFMYGQRDEPYAVVARLGKQMEATPTPNGVLPTLVETVAHALRLPYVGLETSAGALPALQAEYGTQPARVLRLPMLYQAEPIGQLVIAPRVPNEEFSAADLALLTTIAQQLGTAVHAAQLAADLQRSRERLVMAREEERRRIRRDLHDGLGPLLAALAMEADTAREYAARDVSRTQELLANITNRAETAIQDVRRLVYDLRPPALDELGLVGALRQYTATLAEQICITMDVPQALPPLPAAVEVAAYRIAQEALNNVVRHAQARSCTLRITTNHFLQVEVRDDGVGIAPGTRSGVGLVSMRERAAELGGTCLLEAAPGGGTQLTACLPLNHT